jgi:hypothetical protein
MTDELLVLAGGETVRIWLSGYTAYGHRAIGMGYM